jgi:hypothetical protein
MDNTDAGFTGENEQATEDAQTPAVKPFWRSFTREDARLYWITFGATLAGTIASVIAVGVAGLVIKWISSSTAPSNASCTQCASVASPTIPAWAWFAAGVLVLIVFLIVVARRRMKRGKTYGAPAGLAMAVAIFGVLVLLGYWLFG